MRLLFLLLLVLNLSNAQNIALLIGNSDYSFAPLKNPTHDVDGIAKTLKEIGFYNIKVLKNVSQSQMQKALANFSQKAQSAEIALIYFSGHGMQVNNRNYLFPARTTAKKPVDLFGLIDLDYLIQSATSAKYGIVLVDACRDNPLVKYFNNGKKGSLKKGLGQVTPTSGQVVIGFATSAGDTADDGNGDMSPYAKALSVRLKESDDIRNILGKVAKDVSKKYEQNPIYRANLAKSVFLNKKDKNNFKNIVILKNVEWWIDIMDYGKYDIMYEDQQENKELQISLSQARLYCETLKLNGFNDWRLPPIGVLKEVYKNKNKFKYMSSDYYFSDTFRVGMAIYYYDIFNGKDVKELSEFEENKVENFHHVRCVRKIKK